MLTIQCMVNTKQMSVSKIIGLVLLGVVGFMLISYAFWGAFIPMRIFEKAVEREVIQQSPQYVISQNSALNKLYVEYEKSEGGTKIAIKHQMCDIASTIPASEVSNKNIINICR